VYQIILKQTIIYCQVLILLIYNVFAVKPKILDVANILLILLIAIILFERFYPEQGFFKPATSQAPEVSQENTWGKNRVFPEDFTENESLILTEQKHDYERVTEEDQKTYDKYLSLLKSERSKKREISVFRYGNDCFARPVIVEMPYGNKLTVKNTGSEKLNIGIGKGNWDLAPEEQIAVTPEFDNIKEGENLQGYSCSELGLAGYLILTK
jgi:hypothetical protein